MKKEIKEKDKEARLLTTAFELFTEKGIKDTSIQEIVDRANVAKGTFYLYFKDKYQIRDILIAKKSEKLFKDALEELRKNYITNLSDQVIFIINHVINELIKMPALLKFISKNLSWGIYHSTILKIYEETEEKEDSMYKLFLKGVEENNINLKNPEVTLYIIIELVSSTCFTSILHNEPLPIDDFKPYLYETIRKMIEG
ncbi:MAG: TetR/AcrR family transcriptional regulator [Clostridia bacterium]|jgi:AcrR family transcriptional regulator|nr:TetR/AcrR family transcriptional regulator [Clostridia bacterium]